MEQRSVHVKTSHNRIFHLILKKRVRDHEVMKICRYSKNCLTWNQTHISHRGEAELRSTCDTNMNNYDKNQTEKKEKTSKSRFYQKKIPTKDQNIREKITCTIGNSKKKLWECYKVRKLSKKSFLRN